MLRFICDTPDRITARAFITFGTGACQCCNFWRGAVFGGVLVGAVATAVALGPIGGAMVAAVGGGTLWLAGRILNR